MVFPVGFAHFRTPFNTPSNQLNTKQTTPFTADHLRGPLCDYYTMKEQPKGSPRLQEGVVSTSCAAEPTASRSTIASDATIGQRVRKRRQTDRDMTLSCSTECISASKVSNKLPVSQSDSQLFDGATPIASSRRRPLLKAMFGRVKNSDKRKGFIHDPGFDVQKHTVSKRGRKCKNEDNVCLVSSDDDGINECSVSGTDNEPKAMNSSTNSEGSYSNSRSSSLYKTPPIFKSPGLLKKVASEISERFQFTPKQLAPMPNINDSYLFAVEQSNTQDNASPELCPGRVAFETETPNNNDDGYCLSVYNSTTPAFRNNPHISVASNTRSKSKSVAKMRISPFFLTKSKHQSAKLSRYGVHIEYTL